jgi:hypothetical protein
VAEFSEPIDCASVSATSTFKIKDADTNTDVPGSFSCSGSKVTFKPTLGLVINASYAVTLTAGIKDPAGNALADAPQTWSFRVRDAAWQPTTAMDSTSRGNSVHVAISSTGDAAVTWSRTNVSNGSGNLWANRWSAANSKWGGAEPIQTDVEQSVRDAAIKADANGNFVAVWGQAQSGWGAKYQVYASRFVVGFGWSTPVQISTDATTSTIALDLAVQSNGDAAVVWIQSDPLSNDNFVGWASRFTASTSQWTTAKAFATDARSCGVALDDAGVATIAYTISTSPNTSAFTWPSASAAFGAAAALESNTSGTPSQDVSIHADAAGNVSAVWNRQAESTCKVWWNKRSASSNWGASAECLNSSSNFGTPTPVNFTTSANGRSIAVWSESDITTDKSGVECRQRLAADSGTYWGRDNSVLTELPIVGPHGLYEKTSRDAAPRVAIDFKGNALALWSKYTAGFGDSVWYNRFTYATSTPGWSGMLQLSTTDALTLDFDVASHPSGLMLTAWTEQESGGEPHVFARWMR